MEQGKKIALLKAAAELFSTNGYHNISVREICEHAGVTKPVLYYYFKDKEDVLAELINEGHQHFKELISKYINPDSSFEDSLDGLLKVYRDYSDFFPYLIRISAYVQLTPLPKRIKEISDKKKKEITNEINLIFAKGIKEKYFDKDTEPEMLAYSFIAPVIIFVMQNIMLKKNVIPLKDNLKKYFDFWKSQFIKKGYNRS